MIIDTDKIKEVIESKDVSILELAALSNVNSATIQNYRENRRGYESISLGFAKQIAVAADLIINTPELKTKITWTREVVGAYNNTDKNCVIYLNLKEKRVYAYDDDPKNIDSDNCIKLLDKRTGPKKANVKALKILIAAELEKRNQNGN